MNLSVDDLRVIERAMRERVETLARLAATEPDLVSIWERDLAEARAVYGRVLHAYTHAMADAGVYVNPAMLSRGGGA